MHRHLDPSAGWGLAVVDRRCHFCLKPLPLTLKGHLGIDPPWAAAPIGRTNCLENQDSLGDQSCRDLEKSGYKLPTAQNFTIKDPESKSGVLASPTTRGLWLSVLSLAVCLVSPVQALLAGHILCV